MFIGVVQQPRSLNENIVWTKEVSFKTGISPWLILELSKAIDQENFEYFINLSVTDYIRWFFNWLGQKSEYINSIFTKSGTIIQIKKATGVKQEANDVNVITAKFPNLTNLLIQYVEGKTMVELDSSIPGRSNLYLDKARNFVIRLVPELSFSFGLLSMIIVEKGNQQGIGKNQLNWTVKALASCIREGFDDVELLFFKRNNQLLMRVDTHIKYLLS